MFDEDREPAVLTSDPTPAPRLQLYAGGQTRRAEFRFAIGRALGTVVVTLHGEIVAAVVPELRAVLADLIDGQGNLSVAVDLRDVQRVDPLAMAVLTGAGESCRKRGGSLTLCWETHDALRRLEPRARADQSPVRALCIASHPSVIPERQGQVG